MVCRVRKNAYICDDMKRYVEIAVTAVVLAMLTAGLWSCGGESDAERRMAEAEVLMSERPDTALIIMESIDRSALRTERERALHALLLTQAMDKNHRDLTGDTLMGSALTYFDGDGDLRRRMLSNLYMGKIYQQREDYANSMAYFFRAYDQAVESDDDFWAGMAARGISDNYLDTNNPKEELNYAEKEYAHFKAYRKHPYIDYAMLDLARAYSSSGNFEASIKLSHQLLDYASKHHDVSLKIAAERIIGFIHVSKLEYEPAVATYWKICESGNALKSDSIYLAFSLAKTGAAAEALDLIERIPGEDKLKSYARYILAKNRSDYEIALNELDSLNRKNVADFIKRENHNVTTAVVNAVEASHRELEMKLEQSNFRFKAFTAILALAFLLVLIAALYFKSRKDHESSRRIEFVNQLKEQLNSVTGKSKRETDLLKELALSKYELLDEICSSMYESNLTKSGRKISKAMEEMTEGMSIGGKRIADMEKEADALHGNDYTAFRTDLPGLKTEDYHLFLFSMFGFSSITISLLLKTDNLNAVYGRKRRMKEKLKKLEPEKRLKYIRYLS